MEYPEIPSATQEQTTEVTVVSSPLTLDIDDNDLVSVIEFKISEAEAFYKNELKLESRRRTNVEMWLGKQLDESKLYDWQARYQDNIIWQDLETRISIAASRMPDIIVTPSDESEEKRDIAKQLEKGLDIKIKSDSSKRLIKHGLRNLHLYLQSAIKCRWDPNKGKDGDFLFELVRPARMIVDHTAIIPDEGFTADNMEMIVEWLEKPVSLVMSEFPAKRDELMRELGIIKGTARQMSSKIKYQEVWFTWYDKQGKKFDGVCWKYNKLILGKMKNPYFDWEGYTKSRQEPNVENGMTEMDENGQPLMVDTLYHNHFDRPRPPYIFLTHQNLGRSPVDDTSAVEQSIPLQKAVNKRGRQITELADRSNPKLGFAGKYITKEDARRVTNDPDEHIWLQNADNINQAMTSIPGSPPSPVLLNDLLVNRSQIDSKFATHSTTRGEIQPNESGISKQITREGDLMISDDLANIVVERVVYEMANWATQMMKVMYDKPHYVKDLGANGELLQAELQRDKIDDGILVNVKASTTDQQQKRMDALTLAGQGSIDPLSLIEDLDMPNPKERAKRLIAFLSKDFQTYAQTIGVELWGGGQPPQEGVQSGMPGQGGGQQQAVLDIQRLQAGEQFEPSPPDADYVQTLIEYVNSDDFANQPEQVKMAFRDFVGKLKQTLSAGQETTQPLAPVV
ncbi:MAG TPA: hypothetical protein VJ327_00255 [Patescibacteria group bacterium]|nr:hypothetical protein [Patescibacteria group bacterium]